MIVILMGVSGAGKSTIGGLLAQRAGLIFADADDFHPAANKAKMAAGHPLDDADRKPWLEELNRILRGWQQAGQGGVMACSALRQSYREILSAGLPAHALSFVLLDGPIDLIAGRLAARHHEFMNAALLESQLRTLERPEPDDAFTIVNDREPSIIVDAILAHIATPSGEHHGA